MVEITMEDLKTKYCLTDDFINEMVMSQFLGSIPVSINKQWLDEYLYSKLDTITLAHYASAHKLDLYDFHTLLFMNDIPNLEVNGLDKDWYNHIYLRQQLDTILLNYYNHTTMVINDVYS